MQPLSRLSELFNGTIIYFKTQDCLLKAVLNVIIPGQRFLKWRNSSKNKNPENSLKL